MSVPGKVLFQLPIAATKGAVIASEVQPQVYLITFASPPDNRLLTDFCKAFHLALDIIEAKHEPGVVITTSGITKFYSNGLDLEHAVSTPDFFNSTLYALWRRLITYPMPTIALMTGHAFAGGAMTAMMHDYRFMSPDRGFFCLNEVELGANLQLPMTSVFREKCTPTAYRLLVLEAARLKGPDALREGIVDSLGNLDAVLTYVKERKLVAKAQPGMSGRSVYRALKAGMSPETVRNLEQDGKGQANLTDVPPAEEREVEEIRARAQAWESSNDKAKL